MQPTGNRLLDLLPRLQFDRLRPHLTSEALALNQTLQERGKPVESVVFPTSGMISIVAMMRDGNRAHLLEQRLARWLVTGRECARLLGVSGEDKAPAKVLEFGDERRT